MLKRIVVPQDGSACAKHAFDYALRLAKAEGATLEICSVIDPVDIVGWTPPSPLEEPHIAVAKTDSESVVREAVERAKAAGIPAEGHVELGSPADSILTCAKKGGSDAIVMGTHGRSGFKRLFMGSVAEEVLRSSPCPVVIVREKALIERTRAAARVTGKNVPVAVMRLIEVAPTDFERIYGEIASFMQGPGSELPGVVEAELFGSEDSTRIIIVVQFGSHEHWVRAQWDARVGELLEEIVANSQTLEFSLYRTDRFPAKPAVVKA
jgi:nucleotide-binding universal stress UspA family protein